jgi:hypothetical protein
VRRQAKRDAALAWPETIPKESKAAPLSPHSKFVASFGEESFPNAASGLKLVDRLATISNAVPDCDPIDPIPMNHMNRRRV